METRELETEVVDVIKRRGDVKSFRFSAPPDIDFRAGQIFLLTIRIKGEERTKHFSFSNSPTEKGYIEFTKRITGSEFSQALDNLKVGDWARIRLPFGSLYLNEGCKKVAFLTGGIGITCVRSMCKFATDMRLPVDIIVIYSNRTMEDIIFHDDFKQMETENRRLRIVYTLTSQDIDIKTWKGRVGRISSKMVREEIPDYKERLFYIPGPPGMVDALIDMLVRSLRINNNMIRQERFLGY
jgi:ferredoxin-NADP reductase